MRRIIALIATALAVALIGPIASAEAAAPSSTVTRAEYNRIVTGSFPGTGDTIATVQAKTGNRGVVYERTGKTFLVTGGGGVRYGATQTRAYYSGRKPYFSKPCYDYQVRFVQDTPGGAWRAQHKESYSNICFRPGEEPSY